MRDEQEESMIKQQQIEEKMQDYARMKEQHDALDESQKDEIAASFVLQDLLKRGKLVITDNLQFEINDELSQISSKKK